MAELDIGGGGSGAASGIKAGYVGALWQLLSDPGVSDARKRVAVLEADRQELFAEVLASPAVAGTSTPLALESATLDRMITDSAEMGVLMGNPTVGPLVLTEPGFRSTLLGSNIAIDAMLNSYIARVTIEDTEDLADDCAASSRFLWRLFQNDTAMGHFRASNSFMVTALQNASINYVKAMANASFERVIDHPGQQSGDLLLVSFGYNGTPPKDFIFAVGGNGAVRPGFDDVKRAGAPDLGTEYTISANTTDGRDVRLIRPIVLSADLTARPSNSTGTSDLDLLVIPVSDPDA